MILHQAQAVLSYGLQSYNSEAPLNEAARLGWLSLAEFLLANGAAVDMKDRHVS